MGFEYLIPVTETGELEPQHCKINSDCITHLPIRENITFETSTHIENFDVEVNVYGKAYIQPRWGPKLLSQSTYLIPKIFTC
jgi:hypothetical protein